MPPRRILPAILALLLSAACSGDGKPRDTAMSGGAAVPAPAPVSGDNVIASAVVAVRNSPPEIRRVGFVLPEHKTGRPLAVEAEGYDADGDPVHFDIAWKVNGEPAGTGDRLNVPVRAGDKIVVTVTPSDGESSGKTTTLFREIRSNVIIERQEQLQASGNVVTFRIVASGDGGTSLHYALKDSPAGMRIDPATGWVRWEVAPGLKGRVPFDVLVSDGAGAEASARFTVTISEDEPSVPQ